MQRAFLFLYSTIKNYSPTEPLLLSPSLGGVGEAPTSLSPSQHKPCHYWLILIDKRPKLL